MTSILLPLFALIFFAPGVAFRSGYLKGDALQYPIQPNWFVELILISTLALFIHSVAFYMLSHFPTVEISDKTLELKINAQQAVRLSIYLFLTTIFATISGILTRELVLKTFLDYQLPFLRVSNQWWYFFSGRDSRRNDEIADDFDYIMLDVLVEVNEESLLYSGILDKYYFSGDQLERLHLKEVYRSTFQHEPDLLSDRQRTEAADEVRYNKEYKDAFNSKYKKINGDTIIIPYETVKNMNVSFIKIDYVDLKASPEAISPAPQPSVTQQSNEEWKAFKELLEQKIANADTKDAIKELLVYCDDKAKLAGLKNELLLLSGEWTAIETRERQGLGDESDTKNGATVRFLKILAAVEEALNETG